MIFKTATLFKIATVCTDIEALRETVDIEESIVEAKQGNFVYAWARAVTANVPNGNADIFPLDEIKKAYKTFEGRNMFLDHDTDSVAKAVGKIVAAKLIHDEEEDQFYVGCLLKVCRDTHPLIAANLENGIIDSVSMGASVEVCECNVPGCGCIAKDPEEFCSHLKTLGRIDPKTGVKHCSINKGITFTELSFVSVPADYTAKIKKVFEKAKAFVKTASMLIKSTYKIELEYTAEDKKEIPLHIAYLNYASKNLTADKFFTLNKYNVKDNTLTIDITSNKTSIKDITEDIESILI